MSILRKSLFGGISRLPSFVGIMKRGTGVGKLGWHGNSTGFDGKKFFFSILRNERKKERLVN